MQDEGPRTLCFLSDVLGAFLVLFWVLSRTGLPLADVQVSFLTEGKRTRYEPTGCEND